MTDTSHRTTAESQAVKRAKARKESAAKSMFERTYFLLHRWFPKSLRRRK